MNERNSEDHISKGPLTCSLPLPLALCSLNIPSCPEGLSLSPFNPVRQESYTALGQEFTRKPDRQWWQIMALKFKNDLTVCKIGRLRGILEEPVYPTHILLWLK